MAVDDPVKLLGTLEQRAMTEPVVYDSISRVAPAMQCFEFHSTEEFHQRAEGIASDWLPRLAGRSFHVRIRRRGFKQALTCQAEERSLAEALLAGLQAAGTPRSICYDDPDAVLAIDTVDDRAGMALWTRDDLVRHPLLRPE
jgi:tRNA(Ser,Leu) C12 N-acetylase TAN1